MPMFTQLEEARQSARTQGLRERAVCHVTRPGPPCTELLVFDHVPGNGAGVQVPAGGLESGETPVEAARRECREETGQQGFGPPVYLGSAAWIHPEFRKREMRHFFHLSAPADLPETWDHLAEGRFLFRFRWEPLTCPRLDWDLDLILPPSASQEPSHD